jgi:hypothetical protein
MWSGPRRGARHLEELTEWPSAAKSTSTSTSTSTSITASMEVAVAIAVNLQKTSTAVEAPGTETGYSQSSSFSCGNDWESVVMQKECVHCKAGTECNITQHNTRLSTQVHLRVHPGQWTSLRSWITSMFGAEALGSQVCRFSDQTVMPNPGHYLNILLRISESTHSSFAELTLMNPLVQHAYLCCSRFLCLTFGFVINVNYFLNTQ